MSLALSVVRHCDFKCMFQCNILVGCFDPRKNMVFVMNKKMKRFGVSQSEVSSLWYFISFPHSPPPRLTCTVNVCSLFTLSLKNDKIWSSSEGVIQWEEAWYLRCHFLSYFDIVEPTFRLTFNVNAQHRVLVLPYWLTWYYVDVVEPTYQLTGYLYCRIGWLGIMLIWWNRRSSW